MLHVACWNAICVKGIKKRSKKGIIKIPLQDIALSCGKQRKIANKNRLNQMETLVVKLCANNVIYMCIIHIYGIYHMCVPQLSLCALAPFAWFYKLASEISSSHSTGFPFPVVIPDRRQCPRCYCLSAASMCLCIHAFCCPTCHKLSDDRYATRIVCLHWGTLQRLRDFGTSVMALPFFLFLLLHFFHTYCRCLLKVRYLQCAFLCVCFTFRFFNF